MLEEWRQEDGKFQDSLGSIARPHLKNVKAKQKNRMSRHLSQDFWFLISLTLTLSTSCLHTQICLMGAQGTLPENQVPKMTINRMEIPWGKHAKAN